MYNPRIKSPEDKIIPERRRREYPEVPMDKYREQVIKSVRENPSVVIIGETGSGKTTRIPDFLLEAYPDSKIAITQPRRVAVRSVSKFVAKRRGERVGEDVGYRVRFEDMTTEGTRVNFMTDGILLKMLQGNPLLMKYDVVMVDEAHERGLNTDFSLGLLKQAQAERRKQGKKDLKIIVTSATIEKEKFINYFGGAPLVEAEGRMYPVETHYEESPVGDYTKAAAKKVEYIARGGKPGDILIFMPGEEEIKKTIAEIEKLGIKGIETMPLYGAMAPEDQDRIFTKSPKRKVIVATNIAETSVTIDGVQFVVDSGFIKQKVFNTETGIDDLVIKEHAKSGCEQRKGRAGRTAPGECFRLYTRDEYERREAYQTPEIVRSNLDNVVLTMKDMGITDVKNFDFIDKPKQEAIARAIDSLKILGALDENEKITKIGKEMAGLPLKPEIARMVIEAKKYGCVESICTIAALMGEKSIFVRPKDKETEADNAHRKFKKDGSDFLTLLEVIKQWSATDFSERWARENFLNVRQLFEAGEIRSQLFRELKRKGIAAEDKGFDAEKIQKCIAAGLAKNLLTATGRHGYGQVGGNLKGVFIHPSSVVFSGQPALMVGTDIVTTPKTFVRMCQTVKHEWLPEIAPHLLEEKDAKRFYDPEKDEVWENISYSLRGSYSILAERKREIKDGKIAAEIFSVAMAKGEVDLECVKHNLELVARLNNLRTRSGGKVLAPDLSQWYKTKLGDVKNKREAKYIDEELRINFNDFCSAEIQAETDKLYPETIEVKGRILKIDYVYDEKKIFRAKINTPEDLLFDLNEEDFPRIGDGGRPEITFSSNFGAYYILTGASLEELKNQMDGKRLENLWREFKAPPAPAIENKLGEPLPSWEELNIKPVPYAKDYRGEDVFARPGFEVEEIYDSKSGGNRKVFKIVYWPTEETARKETERALELKKQQDEKEQRRIDRENLMLPANEKYAELKEKMENAFLNYKSYNLDYGAYEELRRKWEEAGAALRYSDADPRKAIELMEEIVAVLDVGGKERERRIALIPAVKARVDELVETTLSKINSEDRERFGLSYNQYAEIQGKWREINETLKTEGHSKNFIPDPEKAAKILDELEQMNLSEQSFSPEQERLMSIFGGKDVYYVKIIRVRGGRVIESFSPKTKEDVDTNPSEISIGKSGRALLVSGNKLTFIYGGGSLGNSWQLNDGDYLFSRDANNVIRVKEDVKAPCGWQALEFAEATGDEYGQEKYREPSRRYEEAPQKTEGGVGAGVFAQLLKKVSVKPKEETPQKEQPEPKIAEKPAEREKMTEEIREKLKNDLEFAGIFIGAVRNTAEPQQKTPNAEKISKLIIRGKDLAKELKNVKEEIGTTDNAARARGKTADILSRAERAAADLARLKNERDDWTKVYKTFMARILEIAKDQGADLDETMLGKIRPAIVELSKQKSEPEDIDGALVSIIIDSME